MKIEKKALKALQKMPKKTSQRFIRSFYAIEQGNTKGLNIKKMKNSQYFRLRIGNYRAIYDINMQVIVIDAGPRGGVYQ